MCNKIYIKKQLSDPSLRFLLEKCKSEENRSATSIKVLLRKVVIDGYIIIIIVIIIIIIIIMAGCFVRVE